MGLGDGTTIRTFKDPWVRGKTNYMVDITSIDPRSDSRVCELFLPGEKKWDMRKVNDMFTYCDAEAISALPIPQNQATDRIIWPFTKDGAYSVKSGYNLLA